MTRRGLALLAALAAACIALGFVPLAQAGTGTLVPTVESWYQPNPSCGTPVGCVTTDALPASPPTAPPSSPYPAGTMHVGYAGGNETARSYLVFDFSSLAGTPTGAELEVPLDTAQADGDLQSSTAKVQVCLVTGSVIKAEGSMGSPPGVDCASHASMTYVATPSPHLQADLSAFAADLPGTGGIALLPDATKAAQTDAWRVVFSAHDRTDAAKTPPASLSVTVPDQPEQSVPQAPAVDVPQAPAPTSNGVVSAPLGSVQQPPAVSAPVTAPQVPSVAQPTVAAPRTVTVGYAYPQVWLLPLVLLVLVPLATKALTKDLSPVTVD